MPKDIIKIMQYNTDLLSRLVAERSNNEEFPTWSVSHHVVISDDVPHPFILIRDMSPGLAEYFSKVGDLELEPVGDGRMKVLNADSPHLTAALETSIHEDLGISVESKVKGLARTSRERRDSMLE